MTVCNRQIFRSTHFWTCTAATPNTDFNTLGTKAALTTETKQRKTIPKQTQNETKTICFGFVSALHTCQTKCWNRTKV